MLERLSDSLWVHEQRIRFGGLPLWHRMTVVALQSGTIALHSPTRLDAGLLASLRTLGSVVAVVFPSWWHDLYLHETVRTFPQAAVYVAPTLAKWSRSLSFADVLTNVAPAAWKDEMEQHHVQGIGLFLDEVAFFHKPSRSLIVADLLFNISPADAWITKTLSRIVIGPYPGCRFARFYRPFVFDRTGFRSSIETILEWDFDRIIVGHGAVVETRGKAAFREAFQWLLL